MSLGAACCGLVHLAARHVRVPGRFDAPAARGGVLAIRAYRRTISRHSGRTCLFTPTCSERAAAQLAEFGWNRGIREASAQLRRCGGAFDLLRTVSGEVILIASDGTTFHAAELSPAVLGRSA